MDDLMRAGFKLGKITKPSQTTKNRIMNNLQYKQYDAIIESLLLLACQAQVSLPDEIVDYKSENYHTHLQLFLMGLHNGSL